VAFCASCGSALTGAFCTACGARATTGPRETQPVAASATATAAYMPHPSPQAIPSIDARVRLASGAACPYCFSTLYYRKYTFWHFLIAIFTFPLGLLFLLAPVQRCENGHSYGLGKWIINIIQGILFFLLVIIVLVIWNWPKSASTTQTSQLTTPIQAENTTSSVQQEPASAQTALALSPFATLPLSAVLAATSAVNIGQYGCANNGNDSAAFVFRSDGTGGCANWDDASAGKAADGTWLLLIPTSNAAGETAFSLIYAQTATGRQFLGIMPGDGHGSVNVSIENGYIVERYHGATRTSSYSNGHVSTVSTE
jgi:hypothetical protein